MTPKPVKHGTIYAYQGRGCRCPLCRHASYRYAVERRRINHEAMLKGVKKPPHGSISTYINYGCRCGQCTEAVRVNHAAYRSGRTS